MSNPSSADSPDFTLYTRSYCHLCQDMLAALQALAPPGRPFLVAQIDIDTASDPALLTRYDELVPVLFGDPQQPPLCHYFLDPAAVQAYLAHRHAAAPASLPTGQ
jgi:hypothetical protein